MVKYTRITPSSIVFCLICLMLRKQLLDKHTLVLEGRSLIGTTYPIQVALVMDNGSAFGAMITLEPNEVAVDVSLNGLKTR